MKILLMVIVFVLSVSPGWAETITIEWEFSGTAEAYFLSKNGTPFAKLHTSPADIAHVNVCLFDVFTMTAWTSAGGLTPCSEPYILGADIIKFQQTCHFKNANHHILLTGSDHATLTAQ